MVDESLVAHLKRTVGDDLETQYRQLMQYTDEVVNFTEEQRKQIMQSLYNCKVLDPACGSGAFPMGMLQQMVHILSRIDPDNTQWKEMMLNKAIDETSDAYRTASSDERREIIADIERSFDESVNRPDYARKLYLIEIAFTVSIYSLSPFRLVSCASLFHWSLTRNPMIILLKTLAFVRSRTLKRNLWQPIR